MEQTRKTAGLRIHHRLNLNLGCAPPSRFRAVALALRARLTSASIGSLEVFAQVHSGVHRSNLLAVPVEHQRRSLEEIANPPLAGLAPPRMIDLWIYIGVETVLISSLYLPCIDRLFFGEIDVNYGFDPLESIFPRRNQAHRRTILVRQCFPIEASCEESEWVSSFVQP